MSELINNHSNRLNELKVLLKKLNDSRSSNGVEQTIVYDAREDLKIGIHPVDKVLSGLKSLKEGYKYLLITPFPPVPLILKAKEIGFVAQENKISDNEYHTLFVR